jgi:hypothetical protein
LLICNDAVTAAPTAVISAIRTARRHRCGVAFNSAHNVRIAVVSSPHAARLRLCSGYSEPAAVGGLLSNTNLREITAACLRAKPQYSAKTKTPVQTNHT